MRRIDEWSLNGKISNPPNAEALMQGARSIGNYDLAAALGDLIDNSITAKATTVRLTCNFNEGEPFIIIKDNGCGMTREELITAMQPASSNPWKIAHRMTWTVWINFKSASFSQAKLIVSSKRNGIQNLAVWDLDNISNFEMELLDEEDAKVILEDYDEDLQSDGTLIVWDNCDRLTDSNEISQTEFNEKIMEARSQLALVFHQFLVKSSNRKLTILLNGVEIEGYDPLSSHPATQASYESISYADLGNIKVTPYVLPHFSKLDRKTSELIEGNEGLIRNQGFYVYRNERLIIHGTWFGIFKYGELSDLVRVKVDIPNSMDHIWQISIDKKDAKLPQNLKVRLKKQLESIHIKSKKVYRRRSTPLNIGDHSSAWTKVKKAGRTKFEINRSSKMVTSLIAKLDDEANESLEFLSDILSRCFRLTL